ncbi:MAG: hypothetical protein ACK5NN_12125 [Sphingomonadaceae bacterium]
MAEEITLIVPAPASSGEPGDDFEEQVGGRAIKVSMDKVREGLDSIKDELETLVETIKQKTSGSLEPESVAVGLTVTASGGIGFATLGGAVTLQLTFKL